MLPSYSRQGSSPDGMVALALIIASLSALPAEEQERLLLKAQALLPRATTVHAIEAHSTIGEMLSKT